MWESHIEFGCQKFNVRLLNSRKQNHAVAKSAVSDRGYSAKRLRQDLVSQTAVGYCPGHLFCIKVVREPEFNPACLVECL